MNNKESVIARVTIHRANKMTHKGRTEIAEWLRNLAEHIVQEGDKYASRFSAHYLVAKEDSHGE